jgi:hypothetical protein
MLQHWQDGQVRQIETTLTLPPAMQRAILDFLGQEIAAAKAGLEASLAESRQAATDLATENESLGGQLESQITALAELAAENATQRGRLEQLEAETIRTKHEAALQVEATEARAHSEQQAREAAQVALAKAELRLEALPRLEDESARRQTALDTERIARTDAERLAATAEVKAAGLADRLADAQAQNKQSAAQNERLTAELVQLRSELKETSLAAHAAQRQMDVLQAELASERNALRHRRRRRERQGLSFQLVLNLSARRHPASGNLAVRCWRQRRPLAGPSNLPALMQKTNHRLDHLHHQFPFSQHQRLDHRRDARTLGRFADCLLGQQFGHRAVQGVGQRFQRHQRRQGGARLVARDSGNLHLDEVGELFLGKGGAVAVGSNVAAQPPRQRCTVAFDHKRALENSRLWSGQRAGLVSMQ